MDYRKRRNDEMFVAATIIAMVAVLYMTSVMTSLALELLFFPESKQFLFGRLLVMRMGIWDVDGYLMTILGMLISFGASLVSKRLDRRIGWYVIVYGSMLGLAASLASLLIIDGKPAKFLAECCIYQIPRLDEFSAVDDVRGRVRKVAIAAAIWFIGEIATQFGLKLPKQETGD